VNIVGDASASLRALLPLLERKEDRSWQETIMKNVEKWWETVEAEAHVEANPVNPMRIFSEASPRLPEDVIIAADSGSAANWYARLIRIRGQQRGTLSGTLATMGPAVPYAIGAKFAHPERPAVAFEGDGAMQMNGLAELITIRHYYEQWTDRRLIVAVLHNDDLNQVTWELRAMGGTPKFVESQKLPDISYADFATSIGLRGVTVRDPEQLGNAWEEAFAADRPTVLDIHCDPDVPPIPPHATFEQMKNAAEAMIKGDENRWGVIKEGLKTKAQELLH
jgi:pyruvate dehydrogenase (quinone)